MEVHRRMLQSGLRSLAAKTPVLQMDHKKKLKSGPLMKKNREQSRWEGCKLISFNHTISQFEKLIL